MTIKQWLMAAILFAAAIEGYGQSFPSKNVRLILPFPTGSGFVIGQVLSDGLRETFKPGIAAEPRPGAGGSIALEMVAKAPPDGHMLFQANAGTHAANVSLYPTLSYDPIKDFRPITLMWSFPQLLTVPLDSPARSVDELVALAKSKPGGLSFASQGTGSGGHLLGEMLKARTGANMVHIPYRGAGPAALDLATGRVDFFFVSYSSVLSFLQAGKVRVLAVTSPKRLPALPDSPTMREAGFAGIELDAWFGLVAPAGTPDPVINKLNAAFVQAVKDPDIIRQIVEQGAEPAGNTPAEFAAFIASETERFGKIVRAAGVKGE